MPERPEELVKMVLAIAARGTWLKAERGGARRAASPVGCYSYVSETV